MDKDKAKSSDRFHQITVLPWMLLLSQSNFLRDQRFFQPVLWGRENAFNEKRHIIFMFLKVAVSFSFVFYSWLSRWQVPSRPGSL